MKKWVNQLGVDRIWELVANFFKVQSCGINIRPVLMSQFWESHFLTMNRTSVKLGFDL